MLSHTVVASWDSRRLNEIRPMIPRPSTPQQLTATGYWSTPNIVVFYDHGMNQTCTLLVYIPV